MFAGKADKGSVRVAGLSASEVEEMVVKLGKEGVPNSKIGLVLRDQFAVPSIKEVTGKSVKQILGAHGVEVELPDDLANVIKDAVKIYNHLERNPKDFRTKRSLERLEARINKLATYYRRKGTLSPDWRYDRDRAALMMRRSE